MTDTIEVSEMYLAPQGEGPFLGQSSLFLRLRRCVLACAWCDTKQTWQKGFPGYDEFQSYTPEALAVAMRRLGTQGPGQPPFAIVITGGEPLIWQRLLPRVIDHYIGMGGDSQVEVETAGTIVPTQAMLGRCHFNVSHKLKSAGNEHVKPERLWNAEATASYLVAPSAIFKVVVGADDETMLTLYLTWLAAVAWQHHKSLWPTVASRVYLMPCATTREELVERQSGTMALAAKLGVNVTTRMHILAYGNERSR